MIASIMRGDMRANFQKSCMRLLVVFRCWPLSPTCVCLCRVYVRLSAHVLRLQFLLSLISRSKTNGRTEVNVRRRDSVSVIIVAGVRRRLRRRRRTYLDDGCHCCVQRECCRFQQRARVARARRCRRRPSHVIRVMCSLVACDEYLRAPLEWMLLCACVPFIYL